MGSKENKPAQAEEKQHTLYLNYNRNWTDEPFYTAKVFFLKDGRIGMEQHGRVIIRSIEHWMSLDVTQVEQ